jgi:hypothetical protein
MSWLYSRELEAEFTVQCSTVSKPFAPSKMTPTVRAFYSHGRTTELSRLSQFGTTLERLTDARGEALLTWYREAFLARTSAQPESEKASTASEAVFGAKWQESFLKFDPVTSSWRTHRTLFDMDLPESLATLPLWGLMRNGVVYQRKNAERPMKEIGCGLPPKALWRTLSASECERGAAKDLRKGRQITLKQQLCYPKLFPTLTVDGNYNRKGASRKSGDGLATRLGGTPNPTWSEWFMGFPLGASARADLDRRKFQSWRQSLRDF